MSLIPTATIGDSTITNFNPRFCASLSKELLRTAKQIRKDLSAETDPTLAVRLVKRIHAECAERAEQLVEAADSATDALQKASDVLAGTCEADLLHSDQIVRVASELVISAGQIKLAAPSWDDSSLRELADGFADLANAFGEVSTATRRRATMIATEAEYTTVEAIAQPGSDLENLNGFSLPDGFDDVNGTMIPNPKSRKIDLRNGTTELVDNPEHATVKDEIRRGFKLALLAERNKKSATANRAKSEQKQQTAAEIKSRMKDVWA